MPNPYLSPLRRAASIDPYTDAEQSLLDNAFASPFTRSLQQAVNTDVAGTYRQQALEAQVRGDAAGQRAAEYNRQSALRRMELPTVGPTTWDAAKETGNYGDYVQNVLGGMAGSMVKPLVGASIGGLVGGPLGAAAGGFGGSFSAIRNAELENYANDEQLKTLSPAEQLRVTRNSAALQALPEAIMPAYLGAGGRLPGALNRVPTSLRVAGSVGAGGATEGLQDYISQKVAQNEFPDRQVDWGSVRENAIAGLIGDGAMGVLGRHDVDGGAPTPAARPAAGEVSPMDAVPPTDGGGGGVSGLPNSLGERYGDGPESIGEKAKGLAGAVKDRFGDDIAAAGGKAKDMAGKAKDIVSETVDRMTEAVKTAENPGDFLSKVFGGNVEDEAAADLSGAPNPMLKGLTFEETEANIARDDAKKATRAARYADELLNDPATPDSIKQRVVDMGGDYTNPDNQAFVARTLVAQRGGEKITKAVQDLVDLGKSAFAKGSEAAGEGLSAAKKAVGDAATAAQDRIVKKNLQSATPAEQAAFGKVIFDGLTDEAKANPLVRAQLAQVTNAMMAFAAKTGDVTAKDLPTLTKLSNAMSLFKDPDAMAQTLVEYAGLPRTEDSFLSRIKRITNAQQDLKQPNSFLVSSLTPEAKSQLTAPQLQRVAQLVDQFTVIDSADSKKGTALVQGLASAFGSPESARAVLDYYAQQNKADLRFDPNEGEAARPRSSDDADDIEGFGTLSEQDAKELVPRFRSPNINRPFFRGRDDAASAVELSRGGDLAQRVSMAEHVRASGDSAKFVAGDIRRDLMKRLNDNVSRDTESVREALNAIEAHLKDAPSSGEWAGYSDAVALRNKLRGTKTEDRSAIVKALRDELKALDSAAEKAKRSGKDADEAMLELYDVVLSSPDSSKASDAQMTKFRKLLDTSSDKKTKAENDAIRKTGVTFKIDGKKVAVSLESMVYSSPVRGSVRERLLESLGLVAARADEMPNIPNDAIVKRNYFGDGRHLTWGRLMGMGANPDVKSKARKQFEADPAKEAIKAQLDRVNASSLREYMDKLPKEVDALSAGAELLGRIEGRLAAAKEQMDESPSKVVGDRIRTLSSKRRVLKTYLNEILDADYPVSREAIMDNLESELQADGIVNKEGQKTEYANILFKEELIQTYRDRADAVKGTSLADDALAKADELTIELDKDLSKLQDFQRMDEMDRPSARSKGVGSTAQKKAMSNEDIQTELAAARAELERVQNADLESFRALAANESDSFLVRQNLSQEKLAKAKEDAIAHAQDMVSRWGQHAAGQKKPKAGPDQAASSRETEGAEPIHALDRMVDDGIATLRDGIYYVRDVKATKHIAGSTKSGRIYVNIGMIREKGIAEYVSDSPQKMAVLAEMGITGEQLQEVLGNNKRMAAFLRDHELSHKKSNDRENYPKGADGKLDLNHPRALAIEARATFDALTADERKKLGVGDAPPTEADFRKYKEKTVGVQGPKTEPGTTRQEGGAGAGGFSAMHSSPANHAGVFDWRKFSGSGEGNAAYGAGTYLSTDAGVNNWYRNKFMPGNVSEVVAKSVEQAKKALGPGASAEQLRQHAVDSAKLGLKSFFKGLPDNVFTGEPAKTYDVHVDLDPNTFLDWDGPISANSSVYERIQYILLASDVLSEKPVKEYFLGEDTGLGAFGAPDLKEESVHSVVEDAINDPEKVSGGELYKALASWLGSQAKASELLMEHGIPGSVHSTKSSKRDGGRNYVIFDDQKIRTVDKWSSMKPKRGQPGKVDRQAVIDEIIRTRGKDVKVAVDKLHSALGGSGQYTYNRKTGRRLIEVAINAIDPIGTARHEAMHDFFQFLGENEATRAVARTLKEVMGSKEVMDKLKDLLQGHEAALEQLNDPEERVAYAYQFWAAGALDLGPKSTGIFRTITNFLRDMFGIVTKGQRAVDILNAFHDGDFSNVSTVREALFDQAERDGATFWEKMNHMAPALNKAVLAVSSAAPDRLRRFENDSLNALADKFFTDGGKQGFIQNRFQQEGIWSNKLEAAFAGTTAEERRIALEQLQSMKPVSPLAKKLVEFNSEMYDYMRAAGVKTFDRHQKKWVPLRRVNNYFARVWDGDAIARNRSDFVQLLRSEGGLSPGAAEEVADKLINGREERLTPQEQSILGFTPYAVHTTERVLVFIKPSNADKFAKFQKKDITDIMSNYVQQAVYRAEYARSFGNDGRVISDLIAASGITDKDELTAISNTVQAMEGSLDPDKWSSSTKELMSVMMTAQNVILLPLAIVSQVVDPIVLAARTGDLRDAGTAYINGIKRLWNTVSKNGKKVDGEDLAYILGIVSENSTLQAMGVTASTTRMSKRMEEINRKFFRYNGMQGWNNTMRITATAAAERYIIANKDNAEALAELGIKPGDVKMSTVYVPDGKGKLVEKHSLDVSSREVQQAMFTMVDQSVLRPSAANRPVWMSDPRFVLVGHLKQFTFAMHNVVLKRANKQLENGNAKPWLILTLAAPAVLAADMAKFALTGDMPTSWGFFDYLSHAVNRSGLLGIEGFSTELFSGVGQGKLPGEGLLGPSFEHVAKILRWIGGDPRTDFEDVIDRTVPFAKYI